VRPRHAILTAIVSVAASATFVTAQTNGTPESFKALGINVSDSQGVIGRPFNLTIFVDRWATPSEFALFLSTLKGGGTEGVLKMLRGREQIGVLRTTQPLGFPLSLAVETPQPDGGRRIVIISPRRIYERDPNNPSVDYPLMVMDMRLAVHDAGEGAIAQLARLSMGSDGDRFIVENFDGAKMLLKSVTAAAQSHTSKSQ
jgi:hypothetical protein